MQSWYYLQLATEWRGIRTLDSWRDGKRCLDKNNSSEETTGAAFSKSLSDLRGGGEILVPELWLQGGNHDSFGQSRAALYYVRSEFFSVLPSVIFSNRLFLLLR